MMVPILSAMVVFEAVLVLACSAIAVHYRLRYFAACELLSRGEACLRKMTAILDEQDAKALHAKAIAERN